MKKAILTVMALAMSVMFVSAVMAVEQKAPATPAAVPASSLEKYKGVVEKVDVAKKDFSVKNGKEEMVFSWTDKTKITEGTKTLSFSDLKKGQEVAVEYKKEGDKSVAEAIAVSAPKTVGMKEKTPPEKKAY